MLLSTVTLGSSREPPRCRFGQPFQRMIMDELLGHP
jgi:hypothetical protein